MKKSARSRKLSTLLIFIYRYEKAVGLCPLKLDNEGFLKSSNAGIFYSILLCAVYSFIFFRAIVDRSETFLPVETVLSVISNGFVLILQFAVLIVSWMCFAFRQNKIITIFEDFQKTAEISRKLGLHDDRWENTRTLVIRVIVVNIWFLVLLIYEHVLYDFFPNMDWKIWVPNNFPHILIHNVLALFITALEILERRFRLLNVRLRNLPVYIFKKRNTLQGNPHPRVQRSNISYVFSNTVPLNIETFGELHGQLSELSEIVTDFFALIILLILITSFLQSVWHSYNIYLYASSASLKNKEILMYFDFMLWHFSILIELFFVAIVSGNVCNEANHTGTILSKMWVDYKPVDYQETIRTVSIHLLQRRLSISLYGFINLDYDFIYRICGTVTTYLIIMLQLKDYKLK